MIAPLQITVRNNLSGRFLRLDGVAEGVTISTVVPGGFGSLTFRLAERAARTLQYPIDNFYACDVLVTDQGASTLFEGQLTDVKKHSDANDSYYEVQCTGWMIILDEPYRNIVIERNIPWNPVNVGISPSAIRPDVISLTTGLVQTGDDSLSGVRFDAVNSRAILVGQYMGAQATFPAYVRIKRLNYDFTCDTNHTAQFSVGWFAIDAVGAAVGGALIDTAPGVVTASARSVDTSGSNTRGIVVYMQCTTGGTTAANCFAFLSNIRLLSTRVGVTASTVNEPVYGHEIISDILSQSLLPKDFSGLEIDLSYAVPQFSYPVSITQREALDAITAYYTKFWAVWENKRFTWKSWTPQATADWVVSRDQGAQIDIDPSLDNAARQVKVRWQDAAGIQTEVNLVDPNQDNSYIMAGATKTKIVDLGIVATPSAAVQVGQIYWPDHSYEVVGGTITLACRQPCLSQTYGTMLPAYKIRAGETVRLRDGTGRMGAFQNQSWNRSTLFRITATDIDWDEQTIKLTIDNSQAQLDQLLARVQTSLSSKYGT